MDFLYLRSGNQYFVFQANECSAKASIFAWRNPEKTPLKNSIFYFLLFERLHEKTYSTCWKQLGESLDRKHHGYGKRVQLSQSKYRYFRLPNQKKTGVGMLAD
ncbi:uncharacterized protein [Mycetomoellerius zeteki]|uniref:uncharacterized protein n=1 Tax=Mycetomoellerius zeteki TaxID=64791 RepID=UPI00084E461C|nr:PREDICTED: uncharacterized protein LOC108730906 [Trachymyrmex zeteki]XP_018317940.1 PREDICTED: uncharacterized protein LOC108731889 [Trachymyrmex zeteki]